MHLDTLTTQGDQFWFFFQLAVYVLRSATALVLLFDKAVHCTDKKNSCGMKNQDMKYSAAYGFS